MSYTLPVERSLFVPFENKDTSVVMRVIWWNCGLSALLRKRKQVKVRNKSRIDSKLEQVQSVIYDLIGRSDILVLGEFDWLVDPISIVQDYNSRCASTSAEYDVVDLREDVSGTKIRFDNFIIYNKRLLSFVCSTRCFNVGTGHEPRHYKAFQTVAFKHLKAVWFNFELAVVHWNMRDGYGGDYINHLKLRAADKLSKRFERKSEYPYKLVVGDFNNEPYEEPFRWIKASRSLNYVRRSRELYNPFWRFLDGEHATIVSKNNHSFKDDGAIFDSILVGALFFDNSRDWKLTPCILTDVLKSLIVDNNDHAPVMLQFETY